MHLRYKAQKASGELYEAEREAADSYALARELRALGETLIRADEARLRGDASGSMRHAPLFFSRVSIHDKIVFARSLSGMLGAGLALSRALSVLERQTRNRRLKTITAALLSRIGRGESLSQALAEFPDVFPALVIAMARSGEESGNLAGALFGAAEQMDRVYLLQRKLRGALMYPAIVVCALIIVGVLLFIYVVPQLTATFKELGIALPLSTQVVIGTSDFFSAHALLALALLAGFFLALVLLARSARGKRGIDFALLRLPVIAPLLREVNAARVGHTLSLLLSAGVPVLSALEITAEVVQNVYYKAVLVEARGAVQKGESLSSVLRSNERLYPAFLSEMAAVGEETGQLSKVLREAGSFFEQEVEQKTKDLSTIVEPALMVVVGVAVGFFAVAMITPMYSLMNSI